jgi:signal peptidase I
MENTLQVNDRIAVSKLGSVNRGDVVVFQDPGNWLEGLPALTPVQHALSFVGLYPTGGDLVKRVVGVGGDEVKCCSKDGKIVVNGVPMDEKAYINANEGTSQVPFDVKVPMGSIFVLGDNRAHSADSRFHLDVDKGMVPLSNVVGVVKWIIWPLSRAGSVPASVPLSGLPSSKAS